MITTIPGYKVSTLIYDGFKTVVYRGQREDDGQSVILKLLKKEFPSLQDLALFRHQYAIIQPHTLSGVVKPFRLENYQNGYLLVMKDDGLMSLQQWQKKLQTTDERHIELDDFLTIALQIAQILDDLYHHGIVHKDIKPANILIQPETKQVKLIDFSIASILPRETQTIKHPNVLEGTLAYLSPEQTGRMNRGIDYRTDFYSLGVTFYELLAGELPFPCNDPMELLHCHLAKQPEPLEQKREDIPVVLAQIIRKLMAKNAEDRYQSALGLKSDLENCLCQWKETGRIEDLELGKNDQPDHFLIPEKLYGRDQEVCQLLAAFDRISQVQGDTSNYPQLPNDQSKSELFLVTGFSGIGKTAIINEIHKPILAARGYFIQGKFDQFQRDIPFSALVCAFKNLIEQLLTESPSQVEDWKQKILEALGDNGQVVINVIPELEWMIGKQPPVPQLDGMAAQNRFNWMFSKFIQVFPSAEHPLVLFLDDLQWADLASLQFLQVLLGKKQMHHLLVLGAYRDHEVSQAHPLILAIEEIRKAGTTVNTIVLNPLPQKDLNCWIADTLGCSSEVALPLTRLVKSKTQGNPFFSYQFLHALYDENLITFNRDYGYWECNLSQVQDRVLSEDVVEFMATQLRKLPKTTQEILQFAACLGNSFDLETLAIVCEHDQETVFKSLWPAVKAELILPISQIYRFNKFERNGGFISNHKHKPQIDYCPNPNYPLSHYRFIHDRVQQAAYSSIANNLQRSIHLKIGQLLRRHTQIENRHEKLFEVVNHLNLGIDLIEEESDRRDLAQLNLRAGQRAIASIAYDSALSYLKTGRNIFTQKNWKTDYSLTRQLSINTAKAAYLSGDFETMDWSINDVLQNGKSLLDIMPVHEIKIKYLGAKNQSIEAVKLGLNLLKSLGIDLPEDPTEAEAQQALVDIQAQLAKRSIQDLLELPKMQDPQSLAILQILGNIITLAYQAVPNLVLPILAQKINLSLQYGNCPLSALAYVTYGFILCSLNEIDSGEQFGRLAIQLLDTLNIEEVKAKIILSNTGGIQYWKTLIHETLPDLLLAYRSGLAVGDLYNAGYSLLCYCFTSYFCGHNLRDVEQKIRSYKTEINRIQEEIALSCTNIYHQLVLNLLGTEDRIFCLRGEAYNEEEMLSRHRAINDTTGLFHFYFGKLMLSYLAQEFSTAVENADCAQQYLAGVTGQMVVPQFYFYDALARLAVYPNCDEEEQQNILAKVMNYEVKMQKWAEHAPMNFLNKYHLIKAERHRVVGEKLEAIELYDLALMLAKENELIHEEALAGELAAKFYLELDRTSITYAYATLAKTYMEKAYYAYDRWGATAKLQDLEQRYPQLVSSLQNREHWGLDFFELGTQSTIVSLPKVKVNNTSISSLNPIVETLDLATVIKASQALSGQLNLDQSITTLMKILLENVGAETGALILDRDGELAIEARASNYENDDRGLQVTLLQAIPLESTADIPSGLIHYVWRTSQTVVLDNAIECVTFASDPYIIEYRPKSVLCTPICNQGKTIGLLYLENNLTRGAFTRHRLDFLQFLTTQAAISIENAFLYQNLSAAKQRLEDYNKTLEEKIDARTQELKDKNEELDEKNQFLEKAISDLKRTQAQLIQSEKMSSLGQLVSGIAHEINNPACFISGNLFHAHEYVNELRRLLEVYNQECCPNNSKIKTMIEEIDLDFILQDLPKLMNSMKTGCDRIKKIVLGLRNFSRLDESETKFVDVHEGIDNALMLLQYRLQGKGEYQSIQVIKDYRNLPEVNCYASQINQVFINILNNAIDALEELRIGSVIKNTTPHNFPQIRIQTTIMTGNQVCVRIADNGSGMTEETCKKVFDPFFTTKPIGKGTGLGLSISYQIIVEKHGGMIECYSGLEKGTEFVIQIPIHHSATSQIN